MIFHENRLPADLSHGILCLICYFWNSSKIWNCPLLQIIGGALWVKYIRIGCLSHSKQQSLRWAWLHIYASSLEPWNTWRNETRAKLIRFEPWHEISNNVVCATSKASDQPAHMSSLIRAFASRSGEFRVSKFKRRLHRRVWVYTFQNTTLLEITWRSSYGFPLVIQV